MFVIYINAIEVGTIEAESYRQARKLAKALYGVSCDVIG